MLAPAGSPHTAHSATTRHAEATVQRTEFCSDTTAQRYPASPTWRGRKVGAVSATPLEQRFDALFTLARPLAERFEAAGFELYLVGGCVRDAVIGAPPKAERDVDLTTNARPEAIEALVAPIASSVWDQGRKFGTIGCRIDGVTFEITTFRADAYEPNSRKPIVAFGDNIESDLARRDFTINAMAVRLADHELIDPYDGRLDLLTKRLRTPLDPAISFEDDPLRMLRAARFLARFDLTPDPELIAAVERDHERLAIVSAERIRDELCELLAVPTSAPGLTFLVDTGLAQHFLPELPGLQLEQDPIHRHKDVFTHTLAVVDKTDHTDHILRLAALFHDVGKPKTRAYVNGAVSFRNHDLVGAKMTKTRMRALKFSNDEIADVVRLVELHLRVHTYDLGWTDSAVRRYARDAGPLLNRLNALIRCDCTTRNPKKAAELAARMDDLEDRIDDLRKREDLLSKRPDLDGEAVMAHLGLQPGPIVGKAMKFLTELLHSEGPLGTEEATKRLDVWWAEQNRS